MQEENYQAMQELEKNNWWYKGKRDLFLRILQKLDRKFDSCLDVGCGVGSNFKILNRFSKKVIGIDPFESAIKYSKKHDYDKLLKMSIEKLTFKESFDLVLCSDVLEHIDDKLALAQISKVLKPGGILIFSVPAHNYLWGPTDIISNHIKRYEKQELKDLLKDFKIIKLGYWNFTMFPPNLLFLKILSILHKGNKPKNTLQFTPKPLNKLFYSILKYENKLFINAKLPQGVSIIGICQKK